MMDREFRKLALIFILTFIIGVFVSDCIVLPFSNPWDVNGPLTPIRYNPNNNLIRFMLLILLPSVSLCFYRMLAGEIGIKKYGVALNNINDFAKIDSKRNLLFNIFLLLSLAIVSGSIYSWHHSISHMDNFHEGFSLGPAIEYLNGKIPYKDTIIFHGVFENPFRSVLAFKLFGESIAAVRTLDSCLNIGLLTLLCLTFYVLYFRNAYYSLLSFFLILNFYFIKKGNVFFDGLINRDILFFIYLIVLVLIQRYIAGINAKNSLNAQKLPILIFLSGFIPVLCFAHTVDRGYYLTITSLMLCPVVYLCCPRKKYPELTFWLISGYLSGWICLGIAIKWAYMDFIKYVFFIMPRYKDLMDGLVYPFKDIKYLIPVATISSFIFIFIYQLLRQVFFSRRNISERLKVFFTNYLIEFALIILSVVYFKGFLSRPDHGHIFSSLLPEVILIIYVYFKYLRQYAKKSFNLAISCIIFLTFIFLYIPRSNPSGWYRFPLGILDEQLIPKECLRTADFLKRNLKDNEYFYTLTSEGSWYYFLHRPSPTRFPVLYFAVPNFYQKEIIEDFMKKDVKFIIYSNTIWVNNMDGISTEERFPILIKYIKEHYVYLTNIDNNIIFVKKNMQKIL